MFTSWSPDGEIVLECVHEVKDAAEKKQSADVTASLADMVVLKPDDIKKKMVFPMSQVVNFGCVDVDPEYAVKEGFKTDGQISKNGNEIKMRDLEAWEPEDDD